MEDGFSTVMFSTQNDLHFWVVKLSPALQEIQMAIHIGTASVNLVCVRM